MHIAANTPPPPAPKATSSLFDQHSRYRTQAKVWATLTGIIGCLTVWCFGFIVIGVLVIYAGFLSRLLPHRVTEIYAYVMDPAGGIVGVSVAAALFTAGLWWLASRIIIADTSAGLIWRLRARLPEPESMEDQPLVSSVEELALAAGIPKPVLLLFDGPSLNAVVIGDSHESAGILVSRELLNELDPEEKQGVLAHLLALAANGDLFITTTMLRVFSMLGIALTLLDLPFSPTARKTLAVLWRYARQSDPTAAAPADDVGPALTRASQPDGLESLVIVVRKMIGEESDWRSIVGIVLLLPLFPFLLLRLAAGSIYSLTSVFVFSPLAALLFRSRRRLADTAAVELTHNADGLARGLIHLHGAAPRFTEAGWSEMNCVIGPEAGNARVFDRLRTRIAEAIECANNFNHRLRGTTMPTVPSAAADNHLSTQTGGHNFIFGFHPPLGMRIVGLKKLGAKVAWPDQADQSSWFIVAVVVGVVGGTLLLLLA